METKTLAPIAISVVAILIAGAAYMSHGAPRGGTRGPMQINTSYGNLTLAQLAEIQPSLRAVMRDYSREHYQTYYAAKGGYWELAKYHLGGVRELQKVGETTRPAKAAMLKAFESTYLDPLDKTIDAKDWDAFQTAYNNSVVGCNACHAANGFPYIKVTGFQRMAGGSPSRPLVNSSAA